MHKIAARWMLAPVIILLSLLFIGGPDYHSNTLIKVFWGSGHFALFAGLAYLLSRSSFISGQTFVIKMMTVTVVCIALAFISENLQLLVGRSFELRDIVADCQGAALGFLVANLSRRYGFVKNTVITLICLLLTIFSLSPLISALKDQWQIQNNLPTLANFETDEQINHWDHSFAKPTLASLPEYPGNTWLKVEFLPARYAQVNLINFHRDWQDYQYFSFLIYNPNEAVSKLHVKIFDKAHVANQYQYQDRYSKPFFINPGINNIRVPIEFIKKSPQNRLMKLTDIASVSLFLSRVEQATQLYFDDFKLE